MKHAKIPWLCVSEWPRENILVSPIVVLAPHLGPGPDAIKIEIFEVRTIAHISTM